MPAYCARRGCAHPQDLHDQGRGPCGSVWCPCLSYHPAPRPGLYQSTGQAVGKLLAMLILSTLIVLAVWGLISAVRLLVS